MNASQSVDWVPALAVLAVGLVTGTLVTLRLLAVSRCAAPGRPLAVRDLARKRDALLVQLREMEDTAGKRTPAQLARERYALELETARVLVALDEQRRSQGARRGVRASGWERAAAPVRPARGRLHASLWAIASAAGLLLLGSSVYQSMKPRDPGSSMTGEVSMQGRTAGNSAAPDAEEAAMEAALARDPQDLDARLELVRASADRQDWMRVWKEAGRILEQSPGHPEGLAYQAIVRLVMGQSDVAVNTLAKVVDADPDLAVAYAYLVIGQLKMGRMSDAQATASRGSKRFPDRAQDFRQLLLTSWDAKGTTAPLAPGTGRRVAGTVEMEPSLKGAVAPGSVLFVFAREAGAAGGPPVAVKRLPAAFPAPFELTDADSMMGRPLPDRLVIEARLDSDGDPTTRSPADPKAWIEGVKSGRTDLLLILRR